MKPSYYLSATFVLIAVFSASAIGQDSYKVLHGKWKCDVEKTTELMEKAGVDEGQIADILDEVGSFVLMFGKDGSMSVDAGEMKMKGSWKGTKYDEKEKSGSFEFDADEMVTKVNFKIANKNTIHMAPEGEQMVVFSRVKKSTKSDKKTDDKKDGEPLQYVSLSVQDEKEDFSAPTKMLVGSWQGDKELCEKLLDEMEQDIDEGMREMMLTMIGGMKVSFGADKKFNVAMETPQGDQKIFGTWSFRSYDKEKKEGVISTEPDEESTGNAIDLTVRFLKNDKITLSAGDQPPMGLMKAKSAEKKDDK